MLPVRAAIVLGIFTVWAAGCAQQQANGIYDAAPGTTSVTDAGEDADVADGDVIDESDGSDGDSAMDVPPPGEDLGNPVAADDSGTYVPIDIGSGSTGTGTGTRDSGTGSTSACSGSASCDTCTAESRCGWCASSSSCVSGTASGPTSGSCGSWAWAATDCSTTGTGTGTGTNPCSVGSSSCGECDMYAHCGWCGSTNTCIPGSSSGPTSGSCSRWEYSPSSCSGTGTGTSDPCNAMASDCNGCASTSTCGWCGSTSTCMTSNASGTGPEVGSCSRSQWALLPEECP